MNVPAPQGGFTIPRPPGRAAFAFIFVTVALDMLALGVMIPVLPKLILQFEGGDMARAASMAGIFSFAFAGMQFLFQPVLGALSDRFGRRPIVLLSNLGLGLDYILLALAPNLIWMFAGRLISGFSAASFSTASAYVADITPPEGRAAKFGMLGAAFGVGFVLGPALGGWLGGWDLRAPFWGAALLSLINFAYGYFVLPESLPREKRAAAFVWRSANVLGGFALLRRTRVLRVLGASAFLSFLAYASLPSIWVLYVDYRYQWDAATVGLSLAAVGLGSAIVSGGLVRPLVKRFGEWPMLGLGLLCGVFSFAVYALAPTGALFLLGVPIGALWGLCEPAEQALMSREIGPGEQGLLQGAIGSLRGVTGMIGPLFFAHTFSVSVSSSWFPGLPFLLASALLLASLAVAWRGRAAKGGSSDRAL